MLRINGFAGSVFPVFGGPGSSTTHRHLMHVALENASARAVVIPAGARLFFRARWSHVLGSSPSPPELMVAQPESSGNGAVEVTRSSPGSDRCEVELRWRDSEILAPLGHSIATSIRMDYRSAPRPIAALELEGSGRGSPIAMELPLGVVESIAPRRVVLDHLDVASPIAAFGAPAAAGGRLRTRAAAAANGEVQFFNRVESVSTTPHVMVVSAQSVTGWDLELPTGTTIDFQTRYEVPVSGVTMISRPNDPNFDFVAVNHPSQPNRWRGTVSRGPIRIPTIAPLDLFKVELSYQPRRPQAGYTIHFYGPDDDQPSGPIPIRGGPIFVKGIVPFNPFEVPPEDPEDPEDPEAPEPPRHTGTLIG